MVERVHITGMAPGAVQLFLLDPCAVARQDAAPPEAGRHLGGAAFSRAGKDVQ